MGAEDATREAEREQAGLKGAGESAKGSRIIGRILPAAVKLWLRSQVEQVADLSVSLAGRDRDILSGYLPAVSVSAVRAIYKGIHLGQLTLSAQEIQINAGQVLRGKPLRLLKVFPVVGEAMLSADDLNASLDSALLQGGLRDFWRSLVQHPPFGEAIAARYGQLPLQADVMLHNAQICLGNQCLALSFYPQVGEQLATHRVILGTGLSVVEGHRLQLDSPRWLQALADVTEVSKGEPIASLQGFQWNLGVDTQLSLLSLQPKQLRCHGQFKVNP
jgi:hypothetical protein